MRKPQHRDVETPYCWLAMFCLSAGSAHRLALVYVVSLIHIIPLALDFSFASLHTIPSYGCPTRLRHTLISPSVLCHAPSCVIDTQVGPDLRNGYMGWAMTPDVLKGLRAQVGLADQGKWG